MIVPESQKKENGVNCKKHSDLETAKYFLLFFFRWSFSLNLLTCI